MVKTATVEMTIAELVELYACAKNTALSSNEHQADILHSALKKIRYTYEQATREN